MIVLNRTRERILFLPPEDLTNSRVNCRGFHRGGCPRQESYHLTHTTAPLHSIGVQRGGSPDRGVSCHLSYAPAPLLNSKHLNTAPISRRYQQTRFNTWQKQKKISRLESARGSRFPYSMMSMRISVSRIRCRCLKRRASFGLLSDYPRAPALVARVCRHLPRALRRPAQKTAPRFSRFSRENPTNPTTNPTRSKTLGFSFSSFNKQVVKCA